jgi:hypothetical protein
MSRTPGFTAASAVDHRPARLYAATHVARAGEPMSVTPQAGVGRGRGTCLPNCICAGQEGCPCCPPGPFGPLGPPTRPIRRMLRR